MAATSAELGPVAFTNGWYCPRCTCVTEHKEVLHQQVCLECGLTPRGSKPVEYFQRPEVKAKKREYKKQLTIEKLEAKLAKLRMEESYVGPQ